jgi:hypothetical protein
MFKRKPRTASQLFNYFTERYPNMNVVVIQDTIKKIVDRRKLKAIQRRQGTRLNVAWRKIIPPLASHIQSVVSNQPMHAQTNPEYHAFNEKYLRLLRALRDEMRADQQLGIFPAQSLKDRGLPSKDIDRVAWTDWLENSVKEKVLARYAQLPRTNKTNYRTLFPHPTANTMPKIRQKMRDKIAQDLLISEEAGNSPMLNDSGRAFYAQEQAYLKEALIRLEKLPRKLLTPKTYHGLFTQAERQADYPLVFPPLTPTEGEEA